MVELQTSTLKILNRLFSMLVVYPAVGIFLLLALGSGFSFTGAARWITDMQYEAQQLGQASQEGHLLTKRCYESKPATGEIPQLSACATWKVEEVAVDAAAQEAGQSLRNQYVMFMIIGFCYLLARDFLPPVLRRLKWFNNQMES
ncbi:hypothetical protein C1X72_15525 [Pseudomonas sp. FW306-2-2C-D06B]|uniref:hypothetical protein n=1 Tax=unclassified Pseudomonas TaxID=196821 RepID=UPI000C88A351|nr:MULTISPECIES: hypothetical protein [unclassified Pseudomonas]PMY80297.1 hypothetical protein C1X72_15525 [Pseudomonas sp. FW306-2-2C-D06B]PNA98400.1 hypothetical protein C1X74_11500 [Pseudomonas sp. GW460-5]PNB58858.1 hypothetical protein C1X73_12590 [Pseudomonas sp. FW305-130]POA73620.1 hypothetical protein C1890_27000 [Pseudomonas sp. DP16D-R1]